MLLRTCVLYKEERQIKQGSFGFQIPPTEDKNKLWSSSLIPTAHNSSASCTKSSYPHPHVSLVHISSLIQVPQKATFCPGWQENLGGDTTRGGARLVRVQALAKGLALVFTGRRVNVHGGGRALAEACERSPLLAMTVIGLPSPGKRSRG